MTRVSRIAVALALFGCSNSVEVPPPRTAEIVQTYRQSHEVFVFHKGKRYRIRPEQQPALELTVTKAAVGGVYDGHATEDLSLRLGSISARDDTMYLQEDEPCARPRSATQSSCSKASHPLP